MDSSILAETTELSLDVGERVLVVGANSSGTGKFLIEGQDRYAFMTVGDAKQAKELSGKNYKYVIVNGRVTDILESIQTLADRAKVQSMLVTANGGSLLKMMENFPRSGKGVITFQVPEVIQTIRLHEPPPIRRSSPSNPPDAPRLTTLEELLATGRFEQLNNEFGGDHNKVTAYIRSLGFTKDDITDGALYQRCRIVNKRLGKQRKSQPLIIPPWLLNSDKGKALLAAAEEARSSQQRLAELVAEVATENQQLQDVVQKQLEHIQSLETEINDHCQRAEAARKLLEKQPANQSSAELQS